MSVARKRVEKELRDVWTNPIEGIVAGPADESNMMAWTATIDGPPGTPYAGGKFKLSMNFPSNFPFKPPQCKFLTKVYHCNVSSRGSICLDILKSEWSPVLTVNKLLLSIMTLLSDANPSDPLSADVADMYLSNRAEHDRIAAHWTDMYAKT